MKAGDLVRFSRRQLRLPGVKQEKKHVGLLIEYHTWEKIARVLYEGEILILRAENVEKAGKKDAENK